MTPALGQGEGGVLEIWRLGAKPWRRPIAMAYSLMVVAYSHGGGI